MSKFNLKEQQNAEKVYTELGDEIVKLGCLTVQAGHRQRSALISHVYSNYTKHEELMAEKTAWEEIGYRERIHIGFLDIMNLFKDESGIFINFKGMIVEVDDYIASAVRLEYFEVAEIYSLWKGKLLDFNSSAHSLFLCFFAFLSALNYW
jgi:hypothetical protein